MALPGTRQTDNSWNIQSRIAAQDVERKTARSFFALRRCSFAHDRSNFRLEESMAKKEKTPDRARMLRALGFLRPRWKSAVTALILTLVVALANSVEPLLLKEVVNALTHGHEPGQTESFRGFLVDLLTRVTGLVKEVDAHQIAYVILGLLAGLYLVRGILLLWSTCLTSWLKLLCTRCMLDQAVYSIYHQSLAFHQSTRTGKIMSELDSGVTGFSEALSSIMITLLPYGAFLLCTGGFMAVMNFELTMVVVVCAPLAAVVSMYSGRLLAARQDQIKEQKAELNDQFQQVLVLSKPIISFNMQTSEYERFMSFLDGLLKVMWKREVLAAFLSFLKNRIMDVMRWFILFLGVILTLRGQITIGMLFAFYTYIKSLSDPMLGLLNASETFRLARMYCDTVYDIIDTPNSVVDRPGAVKLADARGVIEFEDVWFGYSGEQQVLKGISFTAKPGSLIAIVGPSGCGKSTIAGLIMRLYDPQGGRVLFDGKDLRDIEQESLREHISVVLQDTGLLSRSIAENIACGRPGATLSEIRRAAQAADADEFIMAKPGGYDNGVGEQGNSLSGGQRQRVAVARALMRDSEVMIFDEPTAALDPESESLVSSIIDELAKTKTVFVITHRLRTIEHADRIIVLEDGKICEHGRHDELVTNHGPYCKLLSL
jgi:ABC-type multidrug transport system fused ATPase/permease subunit